MTGLTFGTRDFGRTTLRPRHRRFVRALGEIMFAPDARSDERLDRLVREVDAMISATSRPLRFALALLFDLLRFGPLFASGKITAFEDLPPDERLTTLVRIETRERLLFGWRLPTLALALVGAKTLLTMVYYEDDAGLSELGYPGPARTRYKLFAARHKNETGRLA